MSERLDGDREAVLRADPSAVTADDVPALLGEVDYLRGQVSGNLLYATQLKQRIKALGGDVRA